MADIELNVEVRDRVGKGGARQARREGKVPGVLYGGARSPVAIAINANAFRKALYSGKLLGHMVTLKYGSETQPVIARDIQFDPVTDFPTHIDLFRVDEHQLVRISVPVHFKNQDISRGLKQGGTLNIVRHDVELYAPADSIPEELVVDLKDARIGDTIRMSAIALPAGVEPAVTERDFVIATLQGVSSQTLEDEAADAAVAEAQHDAAEEAEAEAAAAADDADADTKTDADNG